MRRVVHRTLTSKIYTIYSQKYDLLAEELHWCKYRREKQALIIQVNPYQINNLRRRKSRERPYSRMPEEWYTVIQWKDTNNKKLVSIHGLFRLADEQFNSFEKKRLENSIDFIILYIA